MPADTTAAYYSPGSRPRLPPASGHRWLGVSATGLSLAGLSVAIYMTVAHYTTTTALACPNTGVVNCAKVTTSSYSRLFGIPVVLPGVIFFLAMVALESPAGWRSTAPTVRLGRLALAGAESVMVLWLVYVELFRLNAICLWCTAIHALSLALFFITAVGTALTTQASAQPSPVAPTKGPIV